MSPVSLVLNFHKLPRVVLKVIVGALESDPRTRDIPVEFVNHRASLTDAIEKGAGSQPNGGRGAVVSPLLTLRGGAVLHLVYEYAVPNPAHEPTAASGLRRLAVPSSLRASAEAQRERYE